MALSPAQYSVQSTIPLACLHELLDTITLQCTARLEGILVHVFARSRTSSCLAVSAPHFFVLRLFESQSNPVGGRYLQ